MRKISFKYRIVLTALYFIPFFAFIFFTITLLTSVVLTYYIYDVIILFESPRVKSVVITFFLANLIAHYQVIKSFIQYKKAQTAEDKVPFEEMPMLFQNIFSELKDKLGINKEIHISRNMQGFYIYHYKKTLIIGTPFLALNVLEKRHLSVILRHELLHFKQWDTSFDIWFEKSFRLMSAIRAYLELKNLSLINPIYWIIRIVLFTQKKGWIFRF